MLFVQKSSVISFCFILDGTGSSDLWNRALTSAITTEKAKESSPPASLPLPPKACKTRFASELVSICFFQQQWVRAVNYCAKLKRQGREDEDDSYLVQKKLAHDGDSLQEQLSYISQAFSQLPLFVCRLESQKLNVSEVSKCIDQIRAYLTQSLTHPLEAKYKTGQAVIKRFEDIVKERFLPLLNQTRIDPLLNKTPCHSIRVEADFSLIKHALGKRRHFNDENLTNYLEVMLRQKNTCPDFTERVSTLLKTTKNEH